MRLRRKDKPKPALHLLSESEYQILMDHKHQLEQNIESLDKQVNFLREAKKKSEDKLRDQIDKQTQQIARLNEELEQVRLFALSFCPASSLMGLRLLFLVGNS